LLIRVFDISAVLEYNLCYQWLVQITWMKDFCVHSSVQYLNIALDCIGPSEKLWHTAMIWCWFLVCIDILTLGT